MGLKLNAEVIKSKIMFYTLLKQEYLRSFELPKYTLKILYTIAVLSTSLKCTFVNFGIYKYYWSKDIYGNLSPHICQRPCFWSHNIPAYIKELVTMPANPICLYIYQGVHCMPF